MKIHLIVMTIILFPLFMNAQKFNPQQILPQQNALPFGQELRPKVPEIMPAMKPLYLSRKENAEAKLAREEQKLIKLAKKAWEKEADLKIENENLKNLEYTLEKATNPSLQKKIEKAKKQIAKSQDKLNILKTEVDAKSKIVKDMEKALELVI